MNVNKRCKYLENKRVLCIVFVYNFVNSFELILNFPSITLQTHHIVNAPHLTHTARIQLPNVKITLAKNYNNARHVCVLNIRGNDGKNSLSHCINVSNE